MQVRENRYMEFGKSLMARYFGLEQYYDPLSLLFPEEGTAEEETQQKPGITNIYQLQYLKEENRLYQRNLTFITNLFQNAEQRTVYPVPESGRERKKGGRSLLHSVEHYVTDYRERINHKSHYPVSYQLFVKNAPYFYLGQHVENLQQIQHISNALQLLDGEKRLVSRQQEGVQSREQKPQQEKRALQQKQEALKGSTLREPKTLQEKQKLQAEGMRQDSRGLPVQGIPVEKGNKEHSSIQDKLEYREENVPVELEVLQEKKEPLEKKDMQQQRVFQEKQALLEERKLLEHRVSQEKQALLEERKLLEHRVSQERSQKPHEVVEQDPSETKEPKEQRQIQGQRKIREEKDRKERSLSQEIRELIEARDRKEYRYLHEKKDLQENVYQIQSRELQESGEPASNLVAQREKKGKIQKRFSELLEAVELQAWQKRNALQGKNIVQRNPQTILNVNYFTNINQSLRTQAFYPVLLYPYEQNTPAMIERALHQEQHMPAMTEGALYQEQHSSESLTFRTQVHSKEPQALLNGSYGIQSVQNEKTALWNPLLMKNVWSSPFKAIGMLKGSYHPVNKDQIYPGQTRMISRQIYVPGQNNIVLRQQIYVSGQKDMAARQQICIPGQRDISFKGQNEISMQEDILLRYQNEISMQEDILSKYQNDVLGQKGIRTNQRKHVPEQKDIRTRRKKRETGQRDHLTEQQRVPEQRLLLNQQEYEPEQKDTLPKQQSEVQGRKDTLFHRQKQIPEQRDNFIKRSEETGRKERLVKHPRITEQKEILSNQIKNSTDLKNKLTKPQLFFPEQQLYLPEQRNPSPEQKSLSPEQKRPSPEQKNPAPTPRPLLRKSSSYQEPSIPSPQSPMILNHGQGIMKPLTEKAGFPFLDAIVNQAFHAEGKVSVPQGWQIGRTYSETRYPITEQLYLHDRTVRYSPMDTSRRAETNIRMISSLPEQLVPLIQNPILPLQVLLNLSFPPNQSSQLRPSKEAVVLMNKEERMNGISRGKGTVQKRYENVTLLHESDKAEETQRERSQQAEEYRKLQQEIRHDMAYIKETRTVAEKMNATFDCFQDTRKKEDSREQELVKQGKQMVQEQIEESIHRRIGESVNQISGQVYRRLEQKLKSERDRRGLM